MHPLFDQRRYLIPFRSGLLPQIFCDVLVIGGGVAGMRAAIAAGEQAEVIVLSKTSLDQTNTAWAQGGVAGVLDTPAAEGDSAQRHIDDTLTAGAGLCDESVVRAVCEQGPGRLRELLDWGMAFDRTGSGELSVGREGGHTASRVYHAGGDQTGIILQNALTGRAGATERIRIFDGCFALDLITPHPEPGSPVRGAISFHPRYGLQMIWAKTTILASGGAGQVYRETSNPAGATADGIAMAYRAGATLADMAFVQFHPTVLYLPGAARSLISEAVRGEGALLLDDGGERFMPAEHELAELAPRDIVSRAIVRRIARQGGGRVWLDCRSIDGFVRRFPSIAATLHGFDLDPGKDLIPVHPAAHYTIGGVRADLAGRTDVPGLLCVGEASCTGLHGANRLASNSLLEGLVAGAAAGVLAVDLTHSGNGNASAPVPIVSDIRPSDNGELDIADVRSSLQSAMWKNVGVERTDARLRAAVDMLGFWARYTLDKIFDTPDGWEVQNMLLVSWLIARAAEARKESRGAHWRSDHQHLGDPMHELWRRGNTEPQFTPVVDAVGA